MTETPFHEGELAIQDMLGLREKVHGYASRGIRPFMLDQHRDFFAHLPTLYVGSLDADGQPWASMLTGAPGFLASPSPETLEVTTAIAADDPLLANLRDGAEIGLLGLEFHTRRRNRLNGRAYGISVSGFSLAVSQSFGNCPKYIRARTPEAPTVVRPSPATETRTRLSAADKSLIERADTFFIASVSPNPGLDERHGVDISHRGGTAGFVKTLDDGSLLFPDFSGNRHFNTIGNIHATGTAGLLFSDDTDGSLLHLTGSAEIIAVEDCPFAYEGAERFLRILPRHILWRRHASALVWHAGTPSPFLARTRAWTRRDP